MFEILLKMGNLLCILLSFFIRKKNTHIAVLFLCFIYSSGICSNNKPNYKYKHAITYNPTGSRFGDQICGYSKTKWLSYKYKLPFLFIPFKYSQELTVSC